MDETAREPISKPFSVSPCLRVLRVNRPEAEMYRMLGAGLSVQSVATSCAPPAFGRHAPKAARGLRAPGLLANS